MASSRRLAGILAANVAGYSRLTGISFSSARWRWIRVPSRRKTVWEPSSRAVFRDVYDSIPAVR
jgi:hypothetical protein